MRSITADPVVVGLQQRIAQHREVVTALEAALEAYMRATEGIPTPAQAIARPASTPTRRPRAGTPARRPPTKPPADLDQRILAALPADGAWLRTGHLIAATGERAMAVRRACVALADGGSIERSGTGKGAQVRLAITPSAAPVSPEPLPPPVKAKAASSPGGADLRLVGELNRVLGSGASYDLRELRRNVISACPQISVEEIREAVERMVAGGTVDRVVGGESPRYRKLARRREASA